MNTPAITALCISMLGQLLFIRWAVLSTGDAVLGAELWAGRLGLIAMAVGSVAALYFVCNGGAP